MLLNRKNANALTETHVAAIVSSGCNAHQHCLNRYDFNLCLKTGKLREGSLKSSGSLFQSAGQKWRSFVAHSFLFLFSAQEDRLSPSSEGGRGPEQLISFTRNWKQFWGRDVKDITCIHIVLNSMDLNVSLYYAPVLSRDPCFGIL